MKGVGISREPTFPVGTTLPHTPQQLTDPKGRWIDSEGHHRRQLLRLLRWSRRQGRLRSPVSAGGDPKATGFPFVIGYIDHDLHHQLLHRWHFLPLPDT
ncbi:hypothetical protein ACP70R_043802 [Stipagrostis hirtigluma subsp. patula]